MLKRGTLTGAGAFVLVLLAVSVGAQTRDVTWTNAVGVAITGNSLEKTGGTGWNAGAASAEVLTEGGFVEFSTGEASPRGTSVTTARMCGLSNGDTDQNYTDIDFAIYLTGSGTVQVYEGGVLRGEFGAYGPGDVFRVEAALGRVRYRKNGLVFYVSTGVPSFPLRVDTSLHKRGATLDDVVLGEPAWFSAVGMDPVPSGGEPRELLPGLLSISGSTLTKLGEAGWNAGAVSSTAIRHGDGFVEFTAQETDKDRAAGLSVGDTDQTPGDIDFAIQLRSDGTLEVLESGVSGGVFGPYASGDRLRVEVFEGAVRYLRNGVEFHTSATAPQYPLRADTAFNQPTATLANVLVSPVLWSDAVGVSVDGGDLAKTGTAGFNAGAACTTLLGSGDGYVEFTALETDTTRACGLSLGDTAQDLADIDFAILLGSSETVEVREGGLLRGSLGTYAAGDRFRVEARLGVVSYRRNGVVIYTSAMTPGVPLSADASLDTPGATVLQTQVDDFVWMNDVGVTVHGRDLAKTAGSGWGNAGAVSLQTIASGDGYVEFTASETTTWRMLGLSNGDGSQSYTDIDFALYVGADGLLRVWEGGTGRGAFGSYSLGYLLRVEVQSGVVRYLRNGAVIYTSTATPVYPLLVDTALHTQGATLKDVVFRATSPSVVDTPTFSVPGGAYTVAQTVSLSVSTPGAEIRYTTDGSEPGGGSTLYTTPLSIGTTTTLKAKAFKAGYLPSATSEATYTFNFGSLSAPVLSPATGTYLDSVTVTATADPGATIHYTLNGSDPTSSSAAYAAPVLVERSATVTARAFHPDYTSSPASSETYTIQVGTPSVSLASGNYPAGTRVTVATSTPAARIHYTLDGSVPTEQSLQIASGSWLFVGEYTLRAQAFKTGCEPSGEASATYTVTGGEPGHSRVAAGTDFSVMVANDGGAWIWGVIPGAQGDADETPPPTLTPVQVIGLPYVVAVSAGSGHVLALGVDGSVWGWGDGGAGQLGPDWIPGTSGPVPIFGDALAIAAGGNHSAALKADGTAWTWGWNSSGQLGDGTTTSRGTPASVPGLAGVVALGAGANHTLAVISGGAVQAWGDNSSGQLGDGTSNPGLSPVSVSGLSGVQLVAAGTSHSVALKSDGTLMSWGDNSNGRLGDGTTTPSLVPVAVSLLTAGTNLVVGSGHNLAVEAGLVSSWGTNTSGELGDGTNVDKTVPTVVTGPVNVVALAAGSYHSVAVSAAGEVWTWGNNAYGQLGDGTTAQRLTPIMVAEAGFLWILGAPVFDVLGGTYTAEQTVTITSPIEGAVIHYTTDGLLPTDLSPLYTAPLSISTTTTLKARAFKLDWAPSNVIEATYQMNFGTLAAPGFTPAAGAYVVSVDVAVAGPAGATIRYTTDGSDPVWTSAVYEQPLSLGTTTTLKAAAFHPDWTTSATTVAVYELYPEEVAAPQFSPLGGMQVTGEFITVTCATAGASIHYTTDGQEPTESDSPIASGAMLPVGDFVLKAGAWKSGAKPSAVASARYSLSGGSLSGGWSHSVVALPDGTVWSWGSNSNGALGEPSTVASRSLPGQVVGLSWVVSVASGNYHTLAMTSSGDVWSWGRNNYGQLGHGFTSSRELPTLLSGLQDVTAVAGGAEFSLALKSDGSVWSWGHNYYGQLGYGTAGAGTDSSVPVQVSGLSQIVGIAAGSQFGLAVRADGTVWSWGRDDQGQLGDDLVLMDQLSPVQVDGLSTVAAVSADGQHALALRSDGVVWGWGRNSAGQVGDGTTFRRAVPVQAGLGGITRISAGESHSLAVAETGVVWAWGQQIYGQVGDGTTASSVPSPVHLDNPLDGREIGAGRLHSLAIGADGALWAWGQNGFRQIGDGTTTNRRAPVRVADAGFAWKTGTPAFSPVALSNGVFWSEQNVTLTCATPGASIHYTTDGSDPTEQSPLYSSPVPITVTTPLKTRAFLAGQPESNIASGLYVLRATTPVFSPGYGTYTTPQSVTMSTTTNGATIRYTTDASTPTGSSTLYTGPVAVGTTMTLEAKTFRNGWTESGVRIVNYWMNFGTLAAPTPSPVPGTYTDSVEVSVTTQAGATLHYTLNGSAPTTLSDVYTGPIVLESTTTLRVKAYHRDYDDSPEAGGTYTIDLSAPQLTPGPGTYAVGQTVTLAAAAGTTIHYTLDGTEPTQSHPGLPPGSSVLLTGDTIIAAKAYRDGATTSTTTTAAYTVTGSVPSVFVKASGDTSYFLLPDSELWGWGYNYYGQLGNGTNEIAQKTPLNLPGGATMAQIDAGQNYSLRISSSGAALSSGYNAFGQLGDGTRTTRYSSVGVSATTGLTSVSAVSAGWTHTLAVDLAGGVWGWGANGVGQLGDGTTSRSDFPVDTGLTGAVDVAASQNHSLAVLNDGSVMAWGGNTYGQLGNPAYPGGSTTPIPVAGLTDVVAVAAGSNYSLALKSDGTVIAWGLNTSGQLGDGTKQSKTSPVPVVGLTGVRAVSAGSSHNLALRVDGTLLSWGTNQNGQLGDGSFTGRKSPVHVAGLSGVISVAAGTAHSLAVDLDGQVWSWGANGRGQLGDGTTARRSTPGLIAEAGYAWKVATPTLTPGTSTYTSSQNVVVACATDGATIRYTTNGDDPDTGSPTVVSGGTILVDRSLTLKVVAFKTGLAPSLLASGTYTLSAPRPTASPSSGTYATEQAVTLSSVSGATIHYTMDGTNPTESSSVYTTPIPVDRSTPIWAITRKDGWTTSQRMIWNYTLKVAPATVSPPGGSYGSTQTVTVTSATPGALLRYTTNGSEPMESSPVLPGGGTIEIERTTTLRTKGWRSGWTASDIVTAVYHLNLGDVAIPTFSPAPGTYPGAQVVTMASDTLGSTIRYTLDGSEPTFGSPLYTGGVVVDWTSTLKARALKKDFLPSTSQSGLYEITSTAMAPPTFDPPGGEYTTRQTVTLTSATTGAVIHYTTDGSDPSESSPSVTSGGSVLVDRELPLKARAFAAGFPPSPMRLAAYRITGAVSAGSSHVIALRTDGTLWGWGGNQCGQLGIGSTTASDVPVPVVGLANAVSVSTAGDIFRAHTLVALEDGSVRAWGCNAWGQLGDGTTTNQTSPVQVDTSTGMAGILAVSADFSHSLALSSSGTVWAWGYNQWGQLGDGTTTQRLQPVQTSGLAGIIAVAAGRYHSLALGADGTVWAWGYNASGQLGDGTTTKRSTPVPVSGLTGVTAIAAGWDTSLSLRSEGTSAASVWGWGLAVSPSGHGGLLLDGGREPQSLPIETLSDAVGIASSQRQSLTLRRDPNGGATLWAAGQHRGNSISDGAGGSSTLPMALVSGDFMGMTAGEYLTAVVRRDTSLLVWFSGPDRRGDGFLLGLPGNTDTDPDGDGLTTAQEWNLGTDPWNVDTNGDGVSDGDALAVGLSPTDPDMDDDGVSNAAEWAQGTDPFQADTDGDGVLDGADGFPLDPTRWEPLVPDPLDTTPPDIVLSQPAGAALLGSTP